MTQADAGRRAPGDALEPGVNWLAVQPAGSLDLIDQVNAQAPDISVAARAGLRCVVQGFVYGLPSSNGRPAKADSSEAERFLDAYLLLGERVFDQAKGFFCVVIWDARTETLLAARDPLGIHPLFYARTSRGLVLSPSIATLLACPDVPGTVNRAALADYLRHLYPDPTETYFQAITRVQPGHALTVHRGSIASRRYWDPLFPGRRPEWIDKPELNRFDQLLDEAVARLHVPGRTGIYLSGGLDSVAVGALAADQARLGRALAPLALSLDFPEPFSEKVTQAGVGAQLKLRQLFAALDEALGDGGLLRAAVRSSGGLSAPIQNPWLPAYRSLAERARELGCDVILTGSGGDEWLAVTPLYGADLLRSLRLVEFCRLSWTLYHSYTVVPWLHARNMVWRFGVRPLLVCERNRAFERFAPRRLQARQLRNRRLALDRRPWLAPDRSLRQQLLDRDEEYVRTQAREDDLLPTSGPREYFRECREALTHPLVSMEAEEVFEYSRDAGVRILHPYWDPRLVEFLHATPPELLNSGGRSKGLIREMLARRFPALGFERQRKAITASFFAWSVATQAPAVWRETGGAEALAAAGIVDPGQCAALYEAELPAERPVDGSPVLDHRKTDPMWHILTFESWIRTHS